MKTITTFLMLFYFSRCFAQVATDLDYNNVNATVLDGGIFFSDATISLPGYEIPKGSNVDAIYAMGFWFGGENASGQIKLSAQTFDPQSDLFPGPLTADGSATPATSAQWPQTLFEVTRAEIDTHIASYNTPGYITPTSIVNWPAHGDVSLGFDNYLAPFVDMDNDGIYDPSAGDHPCVEGDQTVYMIMNDKAGIHASSGADPMGIEVHFMLYQYAQGNDLDNTTFIHTKVINRSTASYFDFRFSIFTDTDLGHFNDDFAGSDSTRNLIYTYNGDNFDESNGFSMGYGATPPAIGIMSLSHDLENAISISGQSQPTSLVGFWNMMHGVDVTGFPLMQPGYNTPADFFFNGNPYANTGKYELAAGNAFGDRQIVTTIADDSFLSGEIKEFDYAVVFNQGTDNLESVNGLLSMADFIQSFFDQNAPTCTVLTADLDNTNLPLTATVSPNPSEGEFTVSFDHVITNGTVSVRDLSGRLIMERSIHGINEVILNISQPSGVYFFTVEENGSQGVKKIIIK